jgi:hypothetical protein
MDFVMKYDTMIDKYVYVWSCQLQMVFDSYSWESKNYFSANQMHSKLLSSFSALGIIS